MTRVLLLVMVWEITLSMLSSDLVILSLVFFCDLSVSAAGSGASTFWEVTLRRCRN
jgi:hypothetical protein